MFGFMVVGLLFYIGIIGAFFLKEYMNFYDSKYHRVSNHTFMETFFDKGNNGEYKIFRQLEQINISKLILTNLYIPKKDGSTTEIDVLMITKFGFFVVESKNYSGWVFGNEKHSHWTQTFPNRQKYKFFNPIWQNKGHITALKEVLGITDDSLMQSLIVFSDECKLKKITVSSQGVHVLNRRRLRQVFKRELHDAAPVFTSEDIKAYFRILKPYIRATAQTKELHIQKIKEKLGNGTQTAEK